MALTARLSAHCRMAAIFSPIVIESGLVASISTVIASVFSALPFENAVRRP